LRLSSKRNRGSADDGGGRRGRNPVALEAPARDSAACVLVVAQDDDVRRRGIGRVPVLGPATLRAGLGMRHRRAIPRPRQAVTPRMLRARVTAAIVCVPQVPGAPGRNRMPAASGDSKPAGDEGGEAFAHRLVNGAVAPRGAILARPQVPLLETRPVLAAVGAMRRPRPPAARPSRTSGAANLEPCELRGRRRHRGRQGEDQSASPAGTGLGRDRPLRRSAQALGDGGHVHARLERRPRGRLLKLRQLGESAPACQPCPWRACPGACLGDWNMPIPGMSESTPAHRGSPRKWGFLVSEDRW